LNNLANDALLRVVQMFVLDRMNKREQAIERFKQEHQANQDLVHEVMAEEFKECWICGKPLVVE